MKAEPGLGPGSAFWPGIAGTDAYPPGPGAWL